MGDINEIIQLRFKRSNEAFEVALLLKKAERYNATVNSLYYSSFYAVSGLLLKEGIYSKTHSGLKSKFQEQIIHRGKLNKEEADTYNELFENRQDADYKDFIVSTEEEIERLMERTKKLVDEIKKLINNDSITN